MRREGAPIFEQVRGRTKVVGWVIRGVWYRELDAKNHFLRQPPAICFSNGTVEQGLKLRARIIRCRDWTSGRAYWATTKLLCSPKGGACQRGGYEPQTMLPLEHWKESEKAAVEYWESVEEQLLGPPELEEAPAQGTLGL